MEKIWRREKEHVTTATKRKEYEWGGGGTRVWTRKKTEREPGEWRREVGRDGNSIQWESGKRKKWVKIKLCSTLSVATVLDRIWE